jgi:hypothetical protein
MLTFLPGLHKGLSSAKEASKNRTFGSPVLHFWGHVDLAACWIWIRIPDPIETKCGSSSDIDPDRIRKNASFRIELKIYGQAYTVVSTLYIDAPD